MRDCTNQMIERLDNLLTFKEDNGADGPMKAESYKPMRVSDLLQRIDTIAELIKKDADTRHFELTGEHINPDDPFSFYKTSEDEDYWWDNDIYRSAVYDYLAPLNAASVITRSCIEEEGYIDGAGDDSIPAAIAIRDLNHIVQLNVEPYVTNLGDGGINARPDLNHPTYVLTMPLRNVVMAVRQLIASDQIDENDVVYIMSVDTDDKVSKHNWIIPADLQLASFEREVIQSDIWIEGPVEAYNIDPKTGYRMLNKDWWKDVPDNEPVSGKRYRVEFLCYRDSDICDYTDRGNNAIYALRSLARFEHAYHSEAIGDECRVLAAHVARELKHDIHDLRHLDVNHRNTVT